MLRVLSVALALALTPVSAFANQELVSLEEQLAAAPRDVDLRLDHADLLLGLGRFDEALVDCEIAFSVNPKEAEIPLVRGRIYLAMGELGLAEHHLTIHLSTEHPSPEAYILRGRIREQTRRFEQAVEDYEAARLLRALARR